MGREFAEKTPMSGPDYRTVYSLEAG